MYKVQVLAHKYETTDSLVREFVYLEEALEWLKAQQEKLGNAFINGHIRFYGKVFYWLWGDMTYERMTKS